MSTEELLPRTRFLDTLGLVRHEGKHLAYSLGRVFSQPVNAAWVRALEQRPELADINLAREYSLLFLDTYNRVRTFAAQRMDLKEADLPTLILIEGMTDFPGPEK
ncbi:hypothetical protein [Thermithiobacillus plumbiphilus]|uniref:Uncharacterized protein n=1 Tax=Thermithiobacillus plumbiphilus TaxID=1729899 RepID=A0ABU9D916_9PROT